MTNDNEGFTRSVRYGLLSPSVTLDQAQKALAGVTSTMQKAGVDFLANVAALNSRYYIEVLTEAPLPQSRAPQDYECGVFVCVTRVNDLDYYRGRPPRLPKPMGPS